MKNYHSYLQKRENNAFSSVFQFSTSATLLKALPGGRLNTDCSTSPTEPNPFRQLLSITVDAIWEYDMITGELFDDGKLSQLTGVTDKIADLQSWYSFIHPQDRARVKEKIEHTVKEKNTTWEQEYRIKCDGKSYTAFKEQGLITHIKMVQPRR